MLVIFDLIVCYGVVGVMVFFVCGCGCVGEVYEILVIVVGVVVVVGVDVEVVLVVNCCDCGWWCFGVGLGC